MLVAAIEAGGESMPRLFLFAFFAACTGVQNRPNPGAASLADGTGSTNDVVIAPTGGQGDHPLDPPPPPAERPVTPIDRAIVRQMTRIPQSPGASAEHDT